MWYKISCPAESGCTVSFQPSEGPLWEPEVVATDPLPTAAFHAKRVLIEGKGPMWMYAHTAAMAVRGGASRILVYQPQLEEPVLIYPIQAADRLDSAWLQHREDESGGSIVTFQSPEPGSQWSPVLLPCLLEAAGFWDPGLLTLTGPAANWMYAAATALAATDPNRLIVYFSPKEGRAILLTPLPGRSVDIPPSPSLIQHPGARGKVVGVLGDPNSGKSVLSILLTYGFEHARLKPVWRLDCDHAAGTPQWYLHLLEKNRTADATQLRETQKRPWTTEAERTLATQLNHCANSLKWTIADFPGGIHKGGPIQRIPKGRDVLLRPADHFIILARPDRPESEDGWRDELAKHGLADRILGVVTSSDPTANLSVEVLDSEPAELRAMACGLDRRHLTDRQIQSSLPQWVLLAETIARRAHS
jgi:hypothetical protein